MEQVFQEVAEKCRKANFMETVIKKAHYAPEDRELLWSVLEKILACMEKGAAVSDVMAFCGAKKAKAEDGTDEPGKAKAEDGMDEPGKAKAEDGTDEPGKVEAEDETNAPCGAVREVVMTLGEGVDELQDQFLAEGFLTEAYMVEVLGSEILLLAYAAYNAWVREHTDAVVKRYYFPGTGGSFRVRDDEERQDCEESQNGGKGQDCKIGQENENGEDGGERYREIPLGVEAIPGMLGRSGLPVTCTEGYCMVPKKSVAFYAELTKDKTVVCEGICMGCGRADCPNRMSGVERMQGNRGLDRPLTYGYARILGLFN